MIRHLCSHSVSVLTRAAFAACVVLIIARAGVCDDLVCETEEAKKAIAELTIAINESTKPDPDLYEERGDALMLVGDFDQAFDDYSKAIEHRRSSVNYFLRHKRVDAAVAKGDYREARDDAKRLADMLPKPEALARLALILARSPDEKVKNPKASLNADGMEGGQARLLAAPDRKRACPPSIAFKVRTSCEAPRLKRQWERRVARSRKRAEQEKGT